MATEAPNPRVGVAAVIVNNRGQVLVGKRKGSHGAGRQLAAAQKKGFEILTIVMWTGTWQFPGGHLEHGEGLLECAVREADEETGLSLQGIRIATQTNDIFKAEGKHYITLFAKCIMNDPDAVPELREPNKCEGWVWWDWEKFFTGRQTGEVDGEKLFLPMENLLKQFDSVTELKKMFQ
ncbi:Nudix hydrolase 1 [Beauveria bassiana D1-5]|uniref:Nudix hydrolase 1 n=1 Tax=Beauveria bassiana D1-5 TaxID=1245745 RepID=A0A0A2VFB8_BEABA|nr:Nudix hydrolase 1 [Beauveria bassiana D1-5]